MLMLIAIDAYDKLNTSRAVRSSACTTVTKGAALVRFQAAQRAQWAKAVQDGLMCGDKAAEFPV